MTQNLTIKCCTKCGEPYPATDEYFYRKKNHLHAWCKSCVKKQSAENKKKNREMVATRQRERYYKDIEKARGRSREYYKKTKEAKKEQVREYKRNWQRRHRTKLRAEKMRPFESDDYSDLLPVDEHDWFRSWAVITSWEYAAHFNRKTGLEYPEEKEDLK